MVVSGMDLIQGIWPAWLGLEERDFKFRFNCAPWVCPDSRLETALGLEPCVSGLGMLCGRRSHATWRATLNSNKQPRTRGAEERQKGWLSQS